MRNTWRHIGSQRCRCPGAGTTSSELDSTDEILDRSPHGSVGAAVLGIAVVAGAICTEVAVDTWAVKHIRHIKEREIQRSVLELLHGVV